jgi:hypothetical protein
LSPSRFKGFDSSLYFPVQAHANRADILNTQAIAGELDSIAVFWKKDRFKPVSAFESRVTWPLTGFHSSKEVGKRLVEAMQRSLSAGEIKPGKPNILCSFFFKPSGLVFVAARDLPFVVEPLPLSQRIVVEPPVCLQHNGEFTLLGGVGPQPQFVRFVGHLGFLLIGNVAQNCRFGDRPARACEVGARPQGRKTAAKVRKFLARRVAGERLKLSGKLRNRPTRISLNKEVNVIGHHFQGGNRSLQLGRFFVSRVLSSVFRGRLPKPGGDTSGTKPV